MNMLSPLGSLASLEITPLMIPVVIFVIGGTIAIVTIVTHHLRQKEWYNVVRLSIEKGQPLSQLPAFDPHSPPAWLKSSPSVHRLRTPRHDLRSALILIGVTAGLYFGFSDLQSDGIRVTPGFALIPGCIGAALLINALIGVIFPPKREDVPTLSSKP